MNSPWGDCHIHNTKGRSGPCHNSACLGFHVKTIKLSHKTKAFPILHYLFNKKFELLQLYMSFLQHLSQENDVHIIFENIQRLLEFTSLRTFSNDFDLLCTKLRSADFQKRRLVILFLSEQNEVTKKIHQTWELLSNNALLVCQTREDENCYFKKIHGQCERARS